MFCARPSQSLTNCVSGLLPTEPVVTPAGNVYERRLITAYIAQHQSDPLTKEPLSLSDLIDIKSEPTVHPPRTSAQGSIPGLLSALQDEWDANTLQFFQLKQAHAQLRQELSHALYMNDAAKRTLARVMQERDQARQTLATLQLGGQVAEQPTEEVVEMASDAPRLPEESLKIIQDSHDILSAARKKRPKVSPTAPTADQIAEFKQTWMVEEQHGAAKPGLTALATDSQGALVMTGANDNHGQIYSRAEQAVIATLKGHTKKVTAVVLRAAPDQPLVAVTASADKKIKIFNQPEDGKAWKAQHTISAHEAEITGLALHPSGQFVLSVSQDSTWAIHDLQTATTLLSVSGSNDSNAATEGGFAYTALAVHPDGTLLAAGTTDGIVRIWDIRTAQLVASFPGHEGSCTSIAFSENGYLMACAASADTHVKIWDLRKLAMSHAISVGDRPGVRCVAFDPSATYLAVGGNDVRIFKSKTWEQLAAMDAAVTDVNAIAWSKDGQELMVAGMDRVIRVFASA